MLQSLPTGSVSLYTQTSTILSDNHQETKSGPRISVLLLSTLRTWEQSLRLNEVFSKHQINFIGSVKGGLIYYIFWNGFLVLDNNRVRWRFMISKDLKSYSEALGVHHFQNWSWIVLVSLKQHMCTHTHTHRGTQNWSWTVLVSLKQHMCSHTHTEAHTCRHVHTHVCVTHK